ncbi:dihydroorotase [Weissella uvarum]|uniref:dihydroorotase n=1 Tax=Weissella uvarum TaxID=1479233 RepID=UPI00195FE6C7|nr:dihydroorotase [Weissella uvarum]MBM7618016.1 dihydroorotase [Weissella uvarum]MCM0596235.1 dihydroorotase [Weissella uvarum]
MASLKIKNARVIQHDNELTQTDVVIRDGKITEMAPKLMVKTDRVIDAHGQLLMPGLIDVHVHFREPGFEYKETIATGSKAAARGGFTTVLAMPNLNPVPSTVEAFKQVQALNQANGVINVEQYAAISDGLTSETVDDMQALAQAGAIAFTNDGKGVQSAKTMRDAMAAAKEVNRPLVAHVEDESLVDGGVMNLGARSAELELPGMDPLGESAQLARDLVIAKATGVHYHVAHISTKESVELVRIAKQQGVDVTAEVSPHHLLLDENDIDGDNALFKMNPPLRTSEDRTAVVAGLLDGTLDMVATDHAPHAVEEKERSFVGAAFGITGIETSFQLLYTHLVRSGIATVEQLEQWMVKNPAQAFNLDAPTAVAVGQKADLALFDIDHAHTITADEFVSKGVNSPFIGATIYGQTSMTLMDGEIVYTAAPSVVNE